VYSKGYRLKKEAPSEPKKRAIDVYKQDAPPELLANGRLTPVESRVYRTGKIEDLGSRGASFATSFIVKAIFLCVTALVFCGC